MRRAIQVHAFRGDKQYVAECLDLPVVTQAETLDALAANIQEAISLHLHGENLDIPDPSIVMTLELAALPDVEMA